MPRGPRILPKSGMFHLIARGNNNARVFCNPNDFAQFKNTLSRFIPVDICQVQHFALMHTHFHLLAWVEDTSHLATIMKSTLVSYQYYYGRKYDYRGHLWHGRYRSITISSEAQCLQCARYIELNPVYAGLCADPKDYEWTSFPHHAFGKADPLVCLVNANPLYKGDQHKNTANPDWQNFVMGGIDVRGTSPPVDNSDAARHIIRSNSLPMSKF